MGKLHIIGITENGKFCRESRKDEQAFVRTLLSCRVCGGRTDRIMRKAMLLSLPPAALREICKYSV